MSTEKPVDRALVEQALSLLLNDVRRAAFNPMIGTKMGEDYRLALAGEFWCVEDTLRKALGL